jgi:hypothetical protein
MAETPAEDTGNGGNGPHVWMLVMLAGDDHSEQITIVQTDSEEAADADTDTHAYAYPRLFRDLAVLFPRFADYRDPPSHDRISVHRGPARGDRRLVIPRIAGMAQWGHTIYAFEAEGKITMNRTFTRSTIRCDLLAAQGITVPNVDMIQLVGVGYTETEPFDLFLRTTHTPPDEPRTLRGNDGCLFVDRTKLGICRFVPVNEMTLIAALGKTVGHGNVWAFWGGSEGSTVVVSELRNHPYLVIESGPDRFLVDPSDTQTSHMGIGLIMRYDHASTFPEHIREDRSTT